MSRPFASPGAQNVDWEERVNMDRLRTYRLGRAKAALAASEVGALLLFDFNNIRYVTSTHIGEWARDKMTRFALLTRGGEPHLWDFGSAAKHHRLNCPWLPPENIRGGMIGLGAPSLPKPASSPARPVRSATSSAPRAWPTCRSASISSNRRCWRPWPARASSSATGSRRCSTPAR